MDNTGKAVLFGLSFFIFTLTGIMLQNFILIVLGIITIIIMIIFAVSGNSETKMKANEKFAIALRQNNHIPNKKVLSFNLLNGLSVNEEFEKVVFGSRYTINDDFSLKLFDFKDIIEAKVITNHETLTSTSIESVVSRGVVGGLLLGGIGSIIGAATSKTKSSQKIKELTLEIVVNDVLKPRYILTFYKRDLPLNESSPVIQEIEEWYRTFSVIINRNSKEARSV